MTPDVYWNLEMSEYLVLHRFMRDWQKEQKRQAEETRAKRRRR